jgi:hypothetical protein
MHRINELIHPCNNVNFPTAWKGGKRLQEECEVCARACREKSWFHLGRTWGACREEKQHMGACRGKHSLSGKWKR